MPGRGTSSTGGDRKLTIASCVTGGQVVYRLMKVGQTLAMGEVLFSKKATWRSLDINRQIRQRTAAETGDSAAASGNAAEIPQARRSGRPPEGITGSKGCG